MDIQEESGLSREIHLMNRAFKRNHYSDFPKKHKIATGLVLYKVGGSLWRSFKPMRIH